MAITEVPRLAIELATTEDVTWHEEQVVLHMLSVLETIDDAGLARLERVLAAYRHPQTRDVILEALRIYALPRAQDLAARLDAHWKANESPELFSMLTYLYVIGLSVRRGHTLAIAGIAQGDDGKTRTFHAGDIKADKMMLGIEVMKRRIVDEIIETEDAELDEVDVEEAQPLRD